MKYIAGFEYTDDEWEAMDKPPRRKASEVILDLLLSPTYRIPMTVAEIHIFRDRCLYPLCPRCKITMEREYQSFCDRCGQRLDWNNFENVKKVYIGWSGPKDDDENEEID
jgi:hypothetical protein